MKVPYGSNLLLVKQISVLLALRLVPFGIRRLDALMLPSFESNPHFRNAADFALLFYLVARIGNVIIHLHPKLYLSALRAWQALFWTILFNVLLKLKLGKSERFGAVIWTRLQSGIAFTLQMAV